MKTVIGVFAAFVLIGVCLPAFAGPPFRTDDPEPVAYRHGEAYLFSSGTRDAGGMSGAGPAMEFNYGRFLIMPPSILRSDCKRDEKQLFLDPGGSPSLTAFREEPQFHTFFFHKQVGATPQRSVHDSLEILFADLLNH